MTFNPDDPKYTAYVLGELNDVERAAVDAELHADPRVAALVAEIQTMTQSLAQELRSEALPTPKKNQREEILAAANTPIVVGRSNGKRGGRIAWIMAISASLLLAAGSGWMLRGLSTAMRIEASSSNNLQQLGLAIENHEDKRSSVPPSYGGVSPSAVVGLDPTGSAAHVQDIQFRQGGFTAATPPFGGFDAASMAQMHKSSGPTPSQTSVKGFQFADDGRSDVGGQGLVGQSPNMVLGVDNSNSMKTVSLGANTTRAAPLPTMEPSPGQQIAVQTVRYRIQLASPAVPQVWPVPLPALFLETVICPWRLMRLDFMIIDSICRGLTGRRPTVRRLGATPNRTIHSPTTNSLLSPTIRFLPSRSTSIPPAIPTSVGFFSSRISYRRPARCGLRS